MRGLRSLIKGLRGERRGGGGSFPCPVALAKLLSPRVARGECFPSCSTEGRVTFVPRRGFVFLSRNALSQGGCWRDADLAGPGLQARFILIGGSFPTS